MTTDRGLLALGHRKPSEVVAEIGLSRPATGRQLRLLRHAGPDRRSPFVTGRRMVAYYNDPMRLCPIAAWLAGVEVGVAFPEPLMRAMLPCDGNYRELGDWRTRTVIGSRWANVASANWD